MPTFILSNIANPCHVEILKEKRKTKNKQIFMVSHQTQISPEPDIQGSSTFAFPWNNTIQEKDDENYNCNFKFNSSQKRHLKKDDNNNPKTKLY